MDLSPRNYIMKAGLLTELQIIGGGTAGLTVAQRLAANPQLSVAVIEGGSFYEIDNGNYSQIPAYDVQFSSPDPASIQPLVDWGIVTSPQTVGLHSVPCCTSITRLPTKAKCCCYCTLATG